MRKKILCITTIALIFTAMVLAAPSEVDITGAYKQSGSIRISASGVGNFTTGTLINSLAICLADGTNCPAGTSEVGNASGWLNSSRQVWLANNATNVSVGYVNSRPIFFIDTTSGRVGVNTSTPSRHLEVQGDSNFTGSLYLNGSIIFGGTGTGSATSGNVTGVGTGNTIPLWLSESSIGNSIITQASSLLNIAGSIEVTGTITTNTNLTYANPTSANSTREVWTDSNGATVATRYWNGTALVLSVP